MNRQLPPPLPEWARRDPDAEDPSTFERSYVTAHDWLGKRFDHILATAQEAEREGRVADQFLLSVGAYKLGEVLGYRPRGILSLPDPSPEAEPSSNTYHWLRLQQALCFSRAADVRDGHPDDAALLGRAAVALELLLGGPEAGREMEAKLLPDPATSYRLSRTDVAILTTIAALALWCFVQGGLGFGLLLSGVFLAFIIWPELRR